MSRCKGITNIFLKSVMRRGKGAGAGEKRRFPKTTVKRDKKAF